MYGRFNEEPEAFSSSYEDVLKHEDPVAAMAKRLSNPDKYTLGVFKDNDLIGIATLETKPFIKQEHKAKSVPFCFTKSAWSWSRTSSY